ncbi:BRCT domain-containing protein [Xylocopilactobacillus apis]|uniref:BRCT domain-containing protein n=1 Tax=Xylocopilactobacillus apis TaxID=2932183 RepID=A0AAU9DMM1_9LACO|nr:BRCT domain-containing protein [Xylocopilactobacillus apis]BDR56138.1 hypothetical protein KIMC2_07000 [Xylocopilactobacillus apis]
MEFKNKNVYLIDNDTPIDLTLIVKRLKELGGNQVTISEKKIDYLIYDENKDHDENLAKRFERLKKGNPIVMSPSDFIKEMGFNPNPAYIEWDEYPNYDPWTGEKLSLWQD